MAATRVSIQTVKERGCKQKEKIRDSWPRFAFTALALLWSGAPARSGPGAVPAEEQDQINQAIVKGVQFLKAKQFPAGTWGDYSGQNQIGYSALPGLTLLECGVPAGHSVVRKAADFVRSKADSLSATYDLALAVLFLDRLGDSQDRGLIQTFALRLIAGQNLTGGWSYGCPVLSPADERTLLAGLRGKVPVAALPDSLKNLAVAQNVARTPIPDPAPGSDNCNTHFAILAIWAAQRHAVPMKPTLNLIARRFHTSQNQDGSWSYEFKKGGGAPESPPMTCTGLLGLAIGEGLIKDYLAKHKSANDKDAKKLFQEKQIKKGLEALARHVGAPAGRTKDLPKANLYFLWALERVGMLYDLKTVGDKDWYRWGAEVLVANQAAEGNWDDGGYPGASRVPDTCMALLFLKRINLTEELTKKLAGELDKPANKNPAAPADKPVPPPAAPAKPAAPPAPAPAATAPAPPPKSEPVANAPTNPPGPAPSATVPSNPAPSAPAVNTPAPAAPSPVSPTPAPAAPVETKNAGSRVLPLALGGGALLLLAGSGVVLFLYRRGNSGENRRRESSRSRSGTAPMSNKRGTRGHSPRRAK